jgi:hypothetical protein
METLEPHLAQSDRYRKLQWAYPDGDDQPEVGGRMPAGDLAFLYECLRNAIDSGQAGFQTEAWRNFVWLKGDDLLQALIAIQQALHHEDFFDEEPRSGRE